MSVTISPWVSAIVEPTLNDLLRHTEIIHAYSFSLVGAARENAASFRPLEEKDVILRREVDGGLPLLFSQAAVSLCSYLEAMFDDLIVAILKNDSRARQIGVVATLKLELSDIESKTADELYEYIAELLSEKIRVNLKQGISRFNDLLGVFGLSPSIDDDMRDTIWELYKVRNVLVHRRGIVDRKFVTECPWKGLKSGQAIVVTISDYLRYATAAHRYIQKVMENFATRYSFPVVV